MIKVEAVMRHVLIWIDPNWSLPAQAHNDRKTFQWMTELVAVAYNPSNHPGVKPPYDPKNFDATALATKFVQDLVTEVKNEPHWRDATLAHEVCNPFLLKLQLLTVY